MIPHNGGLSTASMHLETDIALTFSGNKFL